MPGDPDLQIAPEFARWALRSSLTTAREQAGLSPGEVTVRLRWRHERKIKRIEEGAVAVRPNDLKAILKVYGITDQDEINRLVNFAINCKKTSTWAGYVDLYSADARAMFALEGSAATIRKHVPTVVPSLFQTEAYCRALLAGNGNEREQIDRRVKACLDRQRMALGRGTKFDVILGEVVLSRPIGGTAVMRAQVEHLKQLAEQDGVRLRLLPMSAGAHPRVGIPFTLMDFAGAGDLLFLEDAEGITNTISERNRILNYREDFDLLCDLCVGEDFARTLDRIVSQRL